MRCRGRVGEWDERIRDVYHMLTTYYIQSYCMYRCCTQFIIPIQTHINSAYLTGRPIKTITVVFCLFFFCFFHSITPRRRTLRQGTTITGDWHWTCIISENRLPTTIIVPATVYIIIISYLWYYTRIHRCARRVMVLLLYYIVCFVHCIVGTYKCIISRIP